MNEPSGTTAKRFRVTAVFAGLILAGLFARLGAAEYAFRSNLERLPDTEIYRGYAERLYHHEAYRVGDRFALRSPGYPLFLAACWSVAGGMDTRMALVAQAILGTLTGGIVFLIGRSFEQTGAPRGLGAAACAITLIEPYSVMMGVLELSETLFTTLLVSCVWFARYWMLRPSPLLSVALGMFAGAATLVRPSGLLLAALAAGAAICLSSDRKTLFVPLAISAVTMTFLLAPWWIRNNAVLGQPVWTTSNVGESLYDGWNPNATGASEMSFKSAPEVQGLSELAQDAHWRTKALEYAWREPGRVAQLAIVKILRFWSPWPNEPRFRTPAILGATTLASVPIFVFATIGLVAAAMNRWNTRSLGWLVVLPTAYFCLLHAVFVSSVRYRVPIMPLLALSAALGILATLSSLSRNQTRVAVEPAR